MNILNQLQLNFINYLIKLFPTIIITNQLIKNELILVVPVVLINKILLILRDHTNCQFKILSDICAIDYIQLHNRFAIVYNLLSLRYNYRIIIKTFISDIIFVPSISNIYNAANWYEREIWDLFGIFFSNHPDLRRILTDYGFKGHPLRKDFPLTGYIEIRYDELKKNIIYEPLSLSQEFRSFDFQNNWNFFFK